MLVLEIAGGIVLGLLVAGNWAVAWRVGLYLMAWALWAVLAYWVFTTPS